MMGIKKRRSPREIIESEKEPSVERVYVKFPGQELLDVTKKNSEKKVTIDFKKIEGLFNRYNKKYSLFHTHPTLIKGDKNNVLSLQYNRRNL